MRLKMTAAVSLLLLCTGCSSALYGEGTLYLWNGHEGEVSFSVAGRSEGNTVLEFERGALFEDMVAGDYTVTATRAGEVLPPVTMKIERDRMSVFNFDRVGCFARTDVSGMYKRGKAPVRVLQVYNGAEVIELKDLIAVLPGQRLPGEAPRLTREMVFQRFVVVPCNLIEDRDEQIKVAEFVRRLR